MLQRSRLVNLAVAAATGALFIAALFLHGVVSALLLVVVAGFLVLLSAAAWHAVPSRGRRLRVLVVVAVLAIAVVKLASG